jgi:hypothetical protein
MDDNEPQIGYSYGELKYMNEKRLEEVTSVFHCMKVPVTVKEKIFLYFRRFPTESLLNKVDPKTAKDQSKTLRNSNFQINLNNKNKDSKPNNQISIKANNVKTYENPMKVITKSPSEVMSETTKKILNNFPIHRSLLVVNYDKQYDEEFLRTVFGIHGKIRRVFSHKFIRQQENQKKKIFFNIIIFNDQISQLRCFDLEQFQWQLFQKFLPQFKNMSELEKEKIFKDYVSSLENNINFQE